MTPLANGVERTRGTRDALGRFGPGNQAAVGRGNPHAASVAACRRVQFETVTLDDFRAVVRVLVDRAVAGESWAIRELLDRILGRPTHVEPTADPSEPVTLRIEFDKPPK